MKDRNCHSDPLRTPIALIIFNRPELTERVFAAIARVRPTKLLIIADGPRPDIEGEAEKCAAARAVIDRVNWGCDVQKNYAEWNMGCAHRPATGIRWVFEQVEEAIILEDDCLPHPTFFRFCQELLEKYRHDERIMHIAGHNRYGRKQLPFSYSFSGYCISWGWATWRRAFQHYDPEIKLWPTVRQTSCLREMAGNPLAAQHWQGIFDSTYRSMESFNTWDFQWLFACWAHRGLSILPSVNLVANIGFGENATHTKAAHKLADLQADEMIFPLEHPPCMVRDLDSDRLITDQVVRPGRRNTYRRIRQKCADALPPTLRKSLSLVRSRLVSSDL